MANPGWPQNEHANRFDESPSLDVLHLAPKTTVEIVCASSLDSLRKVREHPFFWDKMPKKVRDKAQERIDSGMDVVVFHPMSITSAAERALQMETLRATLPAEQIISMLLVAASTGQMPGTTEELKPAERVKVLGMFLNKILPDSKTIEIDERSEKSDRKRRSLKDLTKAQISAMSEAELRDIIQKAADEGQDA